MLYSKLNSHLIVQLNTFPICSKLSSIIVLCVVFFSEVMVYGVACRFQLSPTSIGKWICYSITTFKCNKLHTFFHMKKYGKKKYLSKSKSHVLKDHRIDNSIS